MLGYTIDQMPSTICICLNNVQSVIVIIIYFENVNFFHAQLGL